MIRYKNTFLIYFFLLLGFHPAIQAQLPENFTDERLAGGWFLPTNLEFDDNGRMYVAQKNGTVWIANEDGSRPETPFIDISEEVGNWGDHGLLGMVLHPNFLNNGYIYLFYAVDRHHLLFWGTDDYDPTADLIEEATIGRVTRYTADKSTNLTSIVPGSRKVLIGESIDSGIPLVHRSHGVGDLIFGEDGMMLASVGDGASYNGADAGGKNISGAFNLQAVEDGIIREAEDVGSYRSQMINSYNGKILRFDPKTGAGHPSNPYYDPANPQAPQSKVWSLGLRNPFRFDLAPESGEHDPDLAKPGKLFIGDVGWVNWEETNVADTAAQNFGWPTYDAAFTNWEYNLDKNIPDNMDVPNPAEGCESDYVSFRDLLLPDQKGGVKKWLNPCDLNYYTIDDVPFFKASQPTIMWPNIPSNIKGFAQVAGYDEEGKAIMIPLNDPNSPIKGDTTKFSGACSIGGTFYTGEAFPEEYQGQYYQADLHGWIRRFDLDENDDIIEIHNFHNAIGPVVELEMNNVDGCIYYIRYDIHEIHRVCFVGNPAPVAIAKADKSFGPSPLNVQFDGSESYDIKDQPISHFWEFGDGTNSTEINPSHQFVADGKNSFYEVKLTVTDSTGKSNTAKLIVSPDNSPPQIEFSSFQDGDLYPINGYTWLPLKANVIDPEHADDELSYSWQVNLHHNTHFHPEPPEDDIESYALIEPVGCGDETYYYRIGLTVTDAGGLSTYHEAEVYPYCGELISDFDYFWANANHKQVNLDWRLNTFAPELDYFVIERGKNPFEFEPIARWTITDERLEYRTIDIPQKQGTYFYRVKTVTKEGLYDYSEAREVKFPVSLLFPNPFTNELQCRVPYPDSEVKLTLYDIAGKEMIKVHEEDWLKIGEIRIINLFGLQPAMYIAVIEQDGWRTVQKIVRQ